MAKLNRASTIGFIGAGKVGGALSVAMAAAGYRVVAVASRTPSSAEAFAARLPDCAAYPDLQGAVDASDIVFITASDDAIPGVAAAARWREGQGVAHCSGVSTLGALSAAAAQGALTGAFHPMQAFSSVENGARSIRGITFGIEADGDMRDCLSEAATALGGSAVFLNAEDKALYHVSGVLMGNLLTCLVGISAEIWEHIGYTRDDGVKALLPMMGAIARNIETAGIPAAVAGPYPRGDIGTARKHLDALAARHPSLLPLYRELALAGLPLAQEQGLDADAAAALRKALADARAPTPPSETTQT